MLCDTRQFFLWCFVKSTIIIIPLKRIWNTTQSHYINQTNFITLESIPNSRIILIPEKISNPRSLFVSCVLYEQSTGERVNQRVFVCDHRRFFWIMYGELIRDEIQRQRQSMGN